MAIRDTSVPDRADAPVLQGAAEIACLLWIYGAVEVVRNFVTGSEAVAERNAVHLVRLERSIDLDVGQRLRVATAGAAWLRLLAEAVYSMHIVAPAVVLVLLYRHHRSSYWRWRNVFVVTMLVGVTCFWLYPLMPPHILASAYHFVDTSTQLHISSVPTNPSALPPLLRTDVFTFSNPYAAMPSLHVAFAIITALAARPLVPRPAARRALFAYPVAMFFAVIVTANHWVLDAVGSCVTVLVAYGLVRGAERLRRPPEPLTAPDPAIEHPFASEPEPVP
jgi:hypothetical protein